MPGERGQPDNPRRPGNPNLPVTEVALHMAAGKGCRGTADAALAGAMDRLRRPEARLLVSWPLVPDGPAALSSKPAHALHYLYVRPCIELLHRRYSQRFY